MSSIKVSRFSFTPTNEGFKPYFTIGRGDVELPPPKTYPIEAVYIKISPDPNVIKKQIENEISSMPLEAQISIVNIRDYINHRKSLINWTFEEIDVTELFRIYDNTGSETKMLEYTSKLNLSSDELNAILKWYDMMGRVYTLHKPFPLFKTFDGRIMHLTGMFDYMSRHGGSACLIRDIHDMLTYSTPTWYSELPPNFYIIPFAFDNLVDLTAVGKWYDAHVV